MAHPSLNIFHRATARWFAETFAGPSPPQEMGWPEIAAGNHTLILAPTGSGKTLAAFLWCLDDIFRRGAEPDAASGVHTLYISPLKALNNDIHCNLQAPLKGIRQCAADHGMTLPEVRAQVRTGDTPAHARQAMVKKPPHILITTPESLYLLLTSERGRAIFHGLRYLIIDEIHALASNKRGAHLSLSLERLMPLCRREPVRIGLSATQRPLHRIAAFLGGQVVAGESSPPPPRPVHIVDCGQRKDLDLKVISPVENFSDLPESSVWPAVIDQLYLLISAHRTTLVFANMRSQTERLARLLNEKHRNLTGDPEAALALAHHGSISRESRYEIEARLKAGKIPAVIATASLELGIDIGSIDLVVQLEAPRHVSSALQRVGRSGHLLSARSKGRIIPLYPSDLDDAVAMADFMQRGEIEETQIPENCLDVLAQQIVAETAMRKWSRRALYNLVRQSYCYRNLSEAAFNSVLEMLAGRFADSPLRNLQARISWDRVNDRLVGVRGSRLLATMNGGAIPDRGYFAVYLAGSGARLGEMEEEFVFESRVGNVFYLGNNEWRIEEIRQDRIVVTPVRSLKPRAPFWKGDVIYRAYESSQKIGAFRRKIMMDNDNSAILSAAQSADENTLVNLRAYLRRQSQATRLVPTDRQIVVERFRDSADEPHVLAHTCCGARVNGLWAMALAAIVEKRYGAQVQYTYDDDGFLLRMPDTGRPLPLKELLSPPSEDIEDILLPALSEAPIFTVRFRYNAARALILSRSRPGKRIPLWLQRLRAADLLQVVRQYPDFPIIVESYRDCLQGVFDLASLKIVLGQIHSGTVAVHVVDTPAPSPMAAGLMFDFVSENLYETDRSRLPGQAAAVSSELLADILDKEQIPAIVSSTLVDEAELRWQHLAAPFKAKDAEALFAIIEKLAPISTEELERRVEGALAHWLESLSAEGRIVQNDSGWAPAASESRGAEAEVSRELRRYLRGHGPVTAKALSAALHVGAHEVESILTTLLREKEVVHGRLIDGDDAETWCDRHNFAELYRRAVSTRRRFTEAARPDIFLAFLLRWHKVGDRSQALESLLDRYAGFSAPLHLFEREVLPSRFGARTGPELASALDALKESVARGQFIARSTRSGEQGRAQATFWPRGRGAMFCNKEALTRVAEQLGSPADFVFAFLKENGASPRRDIEEGCGLTALQVQNALGELAGAGLVTSDNYPAFAAALKTEQPVSVWRPAPFLPARDRERRRGRRQIRAAVHEQVVFGDSRWFLTTSFAVLGKSLSEEQVAERQARLLLQRYGILAKEFYRREQGLLPWHRLFQALRKMEWQGEILRGYFVEGLSGVQFALPAAVELLRQVSAAPLRRKADWAMLSALDPALPFGRGFNWDLRDARGKKVRVVRAQANHLVFLGPTPIFYSDNYGRRLWRLANIPEEALEGCPDVFKRFLLLPTGLRPRRKIEIDEIDDGPAAKCKLADVFKRHGFEASGGKLALWPSGAGS